MCISGCHARPFYRVFLDKSGHRLLLPQSAGKSLVGIWIEASSALWPFRLSIAASSLYRTWYTDHPTQSVRRYWGGRCGKISRQTSWLQP
jgi:hypothetical protein